MDRCDSVMVNANVYGPDLATMNANAQAFAETIGGGALAVDVTYTQITGNPAAENPDQRVAAAAVFRFIYPNGTV